MARGFKGVRSQLVEGEASNNHGATSPQQVQYTQAPVQPATQVSVTPIFHSTSTAKTQVDVSLKFHRF